MERNKYRLFQWDGNGVAELSQTLPKLFTAIHSLMELSGARFFCRPRPCHPGIANLLIGI